MTRKTNQIASMGWIPALALAAALAGGCSSSKAPDVQKAAFWPPYPDEPRLQYLVSFRKSSDVEPPKSKLEELVLGKEPQPVLPVNKPYGVAMWDGKIYVCDLRYASVSIMDLRNHRMAVMGRGGVDSLASPTAIAIAPDGMKYVADIGRGYVYVFDAQDKLFSKIGHKDLKPTGVAIWEDDLYVCDFQTQRVEVFNRRTGKLTRTIGEPGMDSGQFIRPLGIAVDKEGFLYVCDVMKCQVQKFDREGNVVTNFGTISSGIGGLVRPKHIAVDNDGTIFVVDAAFQNVQLFDQIGRVYTFFGGGGSFPGAMQMPAGIAITDQGLDLFRAYVHPAFQAEKLVIVTNQFGDSKVAVYAMGRLKPGKTMSDIAASQGLVKLGTGENKGALHTTLPSGADDFDSGGADTPTTRPTTHPSN